MSTYVTGKVPKKKNIPPTGQAYKKNKGGKYVPISSSNVAKPNKPSPAAVARRKERKQDKRERGQDMRQAGRLAKLEYGPQQRGINRQNAQILRDLQYNLGLLGIDRDKDVATQERFAETGDERLAQIQALLQQQLGAGNEKIAGLYSGAQNQLGQNNAAAIAAIEGATGTAKSQMEADAERLGLTEALADPLSKLETEMQGTKANFAANGASALNNLLSRGTDVNALGVKSEMDAAQRGAGARTDLQSSIQATLADLQSQYGTEAGDLRHGAFAERNENRGKLQDLNQMRGIAQSAAFRQLQEARTEQERQAALDSLAEEMARRSMDLQEDQFGHSSAMDREALDFEKERFGKEFGFKEIQQNFENALAMGANDRAEEAHKLAIKQAKKELAGDKLSPMERRMLELQIGAAEAEIRNINAKTRNTNAETDKLRNPSAADTDYKGRQGAMQFIKDQVPRTERPRARELLNEALNAGAVPGGGHGVAYRWMETKAKEEGWPPKTRNQMLSAVDAYYGKYQ